ncbi:MAG: PQQ-binding-like beta-propeller repeat protein [Planctomycetes bacterium]|nr:PQQ-binding-like beta-propeller repeat protein [Planctomycetota bacterium]
MRLLSRAPRPAALALLALLISATTAHAVITKLTPLAEVLASDHFIFVAKVDKLDPGNKDRPTAVFTLDKKLKGEPPFDRIPVNMTGDDEAKKAGDTKTIFERLDASRQLVFFVRKVDKKVFNAKVFVEGSWFSVIGTLDDDGKTVRWAFMHGEPFLRRTFKGTSAEMVKTVEDALAKKAKPPEPDEKEKPGYGPPVEKKCGTGDETETAAEFAPSSDSNSALRAPGSALLGVIPSFVLVGPLAIVAALFPGVFARMAVGMKRWRAFLVVASLNSTLALLYWVALTYRPQWLAWTPFLAPRAFTIYLAAVALVGLGWAGRRYRRMAGDEPAVTGTPGKTELLSLVGLTAFAAVATALTAIFADWNSTLELPMREFTFIGIALATATVYAGYRAITAAADVPPGGTEPAVRLSLSGESVALGTLLLCGFSAVLLMGARPAAVQGAGTAEAGDAEANFGPRLVGEPVAMEVFDIDEGKNVPVFGRVMSNMALDGDRLVFGADVGGNNGALMSANRHTGKLDWKFAYEGSPPKFLKVVFCTPTIANGKAYCGEGMHTDTDCRMFCVNTADGNVGWKAPFKTASHTEGAPAVADGKVFFPAGDDGVFCVRADTGEKVWQFAGGKAKGIHVDAAPAVQAGTVFVGSGLYSYVAVALDANTGDEKWRTDLKLRAFGAPTVSGSKAFYAVGTGNIGADVWHYDEEDRAPEKDAAGAVVCLDAASGKEEWRFPLPQSCHTGVSADAFSVYVGCRDGCIYALDRRNGKLRWKVNIGAGQPVMSSPTVAASGGFPVAVYAVSAVGLVVCLNPQTGAIVWQKPLPSFRWDGTPTGGVMCSPVVATTPAAAGSKRTVYVGAMTVDPANPVNKTVAVFKFEDVIGE